MKQEVGVLSLEETCLIKLAAMLWIKKDMEKQITKQTNGLVQMEDVLRDLKNLALTLPLAANVKNRFVDIVERVGYEIFVFMTKSQSNYPQMKFHVAEDIQWYPDGLINEKSTYDHYFGKNPNVCLNFECLSIICAERELGQLWPEVSSKIQSLRMNNLLVSYWVHNFQDNLTDFTDSYGHSIVGFEPDKSVPYNMALYCLTFSFKTALTYFFPRMNLLEQRLLADEDITLIRASIMKKILKNPRQEHFKFICSFLEEPIVDVSYFKSITRHMPTDGVIEFLNYLLRKVNFFGNLHYNILKRIFALLQDDAKTVVLSKLDFYVLNLLAKGYFQTFEFAFTNAKDILHQQISSRLKERRCLGLFYIVFRNNQKHLLDKLLLHLSENNEDLFTYLKAALDES